jgi:Mor family transcriptional regulator
VLAIRGEDPQFFRQVGKLGGQLRVRRRLRRGFKRRNEKRERNLALYAEREDTGMTFKALAKKYGINPQRARQIYQQVCWQRERKQLGGWTG